MDNQIETQNHTHKHRIGNWMFVFMLIVAGFFDAISLIPILNGFSLFISGLIFTFWWWKLGLGLIDIKKIINYAVAIIIEIIPGISILPGIILAVTAMFIFSRFEEASGIKLTDKFSHNKQKLYNKDGRIRARRFAATDSRKSIARAKRRKEQSTTQTNLPTNTDM